MPTTQKSIFNFLKKLNYKFQELPFRFPIETLDALLKKFYKEHEQSAFLLNANKNIPSLILKKISNSYLLKAPLQRQSNEHLYIGLSDSLAFLVLFDEPNPEEQSINQQESRFFLTFDPTIINSVFNYFYKYYCRALTVREKKLLIRLKNVETSQLNPYYVSKFQEALLISALDDNNRTKRIQLLEALSFTDESVLITDLAGNIKEANKNHEKHFGKQNQTIRTILPDDVVESALAESYKRSKWQSEITLKTREGTSELMLVTCYLFKDELNRPNGFVFTFKDVTELRRLNHLNKKLIARLRENNVQLSEVNKRLVDANRIKNDLLSVVSHELKTPISTIIGFSELISQRGLSEEAVRSYSEQINESARSLDRLVTDYLDVASNQFGILANKLCTMPLNLVELIRQCFKEQELAFSGKRFELELNTLGYEPIIISETENIHKLFCNLINNSLKYSPSGGKVSVKILNDGENVTVSICDQGIGLTSEQSKQVFEPFYRADNSVTREFTGIGLGLAVSKQIVEMYNGSIWCEPGVDSGTVFYVTLPVNPHKVKTEQKAKTTAQETVQKSNK